MAAEGFRDVLGTNLFPRRCSQPTCLGFGPRLRHFTFAFSPFAAGVLTPCTEIICVRNLPISRSMLNRSGPGGSSRAIARSFVAICSSSCSFVALTSSPSARARPGGGWPRSGKADLPEAGSQTEIVAESHQAAETFRSSTNYFDCAGPVPLHRGIRTDIEYDCFNRNFYRYEYWYSSSSRPGGLSLGFSKLISQRHVSHGRGSGRFFGKGICSAVGGSLTPTDACNSGACLRIAAAARSKTAFASSSALER
jgi:hypothetical protein